MVISFFRVPARFQILAAPLMGIGFMVFSLNSYAAEFTSASFKIIDPVISVGGARSESASFRLESSLGQPAVGIGESGSFKVKGGFLYFAAPAAEEAAAEVSAVAVAPPGDGILLSLLKQFFSTKPPPRIGECKSRLKADFDCDGVVGLKDFSIFLFLSPQPVPNLADLNSDGTIGIGDLSVLFFGWTENLLILAQEEPPLGIPEKDEGIEGLAFVGQKAAWVTSEIQAPERPAVSPRWGYFFSSIFDSIRYAADDFAVWLSAILGKLKQYF